MMVNFLWVIIIVILGCVCFRLRKNVQFLKSRQRLLEDKLKERSEAEKVGQAKFEAVLASMLEGVLVTDCKGGIVLMNPSFKKTFFVPDASEGKRLLEVVRNNAIQEIAERCLRGNERLIAEELELTQPEERCLKVNAVPIHGKAIEGAILVFHDITEMRRLEVLRRDFVANASHELRTPIASIKGYAETLMDGALDDRENVRKFIEIIYHDSDRLAKLVEELLDLSRIESGKMKMTLLPVNLSEVVRRAIEIMSPHARTKSIELSIAKEGPLQVLADQTRLLQVLLNLLDNAIKYTPPKGNVTVSFSAKDETVEVHISDTGIGIPEKDLSRIFERFYRVDKARSRELGGTGLGLSIVKHIIQAHGGQVWANSKLGEGSTFSLTLALAAS